MASVNSGSSSSNNNLSHRRTHNLLLISKLLNQHQHVSPLTLVLDTLEQSGRRLVREYLRRARLARTHTVFLAFETVDSRGRRRYHHHQDHHHTQQQQQQQHQHNRSNIDDFITCYDKTPEQIVQACQGARARAKSGKCLVVIDSLTTLVGLSLGPVAGSSSGLGFSLPAFLSSLLQTQSSSSTPSPSSSSTVSLVAVYHSDVHLEARSENYCHPSPLSLLKYLATTIITVHSLAVLLAEKAAQERSLAAPAFGLNEEAEGILVGLKHTIPAVKTLKAEERGIVLELEHRRKSGRGVHELYFLPTSSSATQSSGSKEKVILLDDHPRFRKELGDEQDEGEQLAGLTTFELGLTERQRLERDGVVLPYFDAQVGGAAGSGRASEGGRILYDMGVEDDFDEEEDEV